MRTTKKILSMILALVMVLGLLPATALATGGDQVYISVSFDGQYINGKNGSPIVYIPVSFDEINSIDLNEYGLSEYLYDPDGDGTYETTALQLIIYAHENIYGGSWSDVTFTGSPGSSYFAGGIFGFTENLNYFLNGEFPIDEALSANSSFAVGATSDHIILETGDFIDIASFTSYAFLWDSAAGFHLFADANDGFVHSYTAETGKTLSVKLLRSYSNMADGTPVLAAESGYELSYGAAFGTADGTLTTDDSGCASVTFNQAGTYYLWCNGNYGIDADPENIVSSPAYATVTVTGESTGGNPGDGSGTGDGEGSEDKPAETDTDTAVVVTADSGIALSAKASFCDDCYETVYAENQVTGIDTVIDWQCSGHGTTPNTYVYSFSVNAFPKEGYSITGITINGTKYTVNSTDDAYDTVYIDEYSYIAENYNCVSTAILSLENTAPGDMEIHIHAQKDAEETPEETPREAQDVSAVLNATMAQMAATVTEPAFGTTAGEWTVFGLARGGYYAKDNAYFTDYYDRIVETVNTTAASVDLNGALHKSKSTDNSRLIVALSAIGKDATSVGDWDLVEAYSANGFDWIKKQGINGTIWALIALDSGNYATTDTTIRQQCVDSIVSLQHDDGGWSLMANKTYASDPDITGMALTALYPYRDQPAVAEACAEAFACLSGLQHDNGTFASGGAECSESCTWVIIACTAWGINPDTDSRFIKNGNSVVDGLLAHYVEEEAMFQHVIGGGANAMGTDQGCYGLVAYDRFVKGKTALYDYSDVTFDAPESNELSATLGLPAEINGGDNFNGIISVNKWNNEAGYKLIDFIMNIPAGVAVTDVTANNRLAGGELTWNVEAETGKLRVVYFDANNNSTLTVTGEEFPAELFTVGFKAENVTGGSKLDIAISGMSVKLTSDSEDEEAMVVVNTDNAKDTVNVVVGLSFSAKCLYTGDDVDLIPSTKKAVAIAVTGINSGSKLTYNDGTNTIEFKYSAEITEKTGVATYVALVDATIAMEHFVNESNFAIPGGNATELTFGDTNGDGVINAQDALNVVDTWLRKGDAPTDDDILTMNVNGDSRINTFDALGIVEAFVNKTDYIVVTKAATITANQ